MNNKSTSNVQMRIYNGKSQIYDFRRELYNKGFKFEKKAYGKSYYHRLVSLDEELVVLQQFCSVNQLRCETIEKAFLRNSSYRKTFYDSMPLFMNKYYICAYCGRILKKDQCTVDHIYPVDKVAHSVLLQKKLQKNKIHDVNDFSNLVAACGRCNCHKRSKMGIWILRGKIGKNYKVWILRYVVRFLIIVIVVVLLLKYTSYIQNHFIYIKNFFQHR